MIDFNYKYGKVTFPDELNLNRYFHDKQVTYQEHINIWLKENAREKSVILDVGANLGLFTVSFSKLFKNSVIHSFECVPYTVNFLRKNVDQNDCENVVIHDYALSSEAGSSNIRFTPKNIGASSFHDEIDFEEIPVQMKRLDDLNLTNVSFIKVDIQGHESSFLKGAKETLIKNDAAVVLELPRRTKEEKHNYQKCTARMAKMGYHYQAGGLKKDRLFSKKPIRTSI